MRAYGLPFSRAGKRAWWGREFLAGRWRRVGWRGVVPARCAGRRFDRCRWRLVMRAERGWPEVARREPRPALHKTLKSVASCRGRQAEPALRLGRRRMACSSWKIVWMSWRMRCMFHSLCYFGGGCAVGVVGLGDARETCGRRGVARSGDRPQRSLGVGVRRLCGGWSTGG